MKTSIKSSLVWFE